MKDKITRFRGREQFRDYLNALLRVPGGTISPGGAAAILQMTRQGIQYLMRHRKFHVWEFYDRSQDQARSVEISAIDVVRYGVEMGHIQRPGEIDLLPDKEWYFTLAKNGVTLEQLEAEQADQPEE